MDALNTLWFMGTIDKFHEGRDWVRDHLSYATVGEVLVFETTIRDLGGFLAAFDVSEDVAILAKANELGSQLLCSIKDTPTGIPDGMTVLNDTNVSGNTMPRSPNLARCNLNLAILPQQLAIKNMTPQLIDSFKSRRK